MTLKFTLAALLVTLASTSVMASSQAQYSHGATIGFAKTDFDLDLNGKGINIKYHLTDADNPIGFITSFTYTKGDDSYFDDVFIYYKKYKLSLTQYSLLAGPSITFQDSVRFYALAGVSKLITNLSFRNYGSSYSLKSNSNNFSWGLGMQIKAENVLIDVSYQNAKSTMFRDVEKINTNTFTIGIGYEF